MTQPTGFGPYPPESVWRFPPPPISRWWLVAAIVSGILGLFAFGGGCAYLTVNGTRDIPGFFDDQRVLDLVSRECELMTSTVKGMSVDGTPSERLDALDDQSKAVRKMVEHIRSMRPEVREADRPLDAWLADWETLVSSRERYIKKLRSGVTADFRTPRTSHGDPITTRMNFAGEEVCTVPKVLLRPELAGGRPA